jgi:hypothetical protein
MNALSAYASGTSNDDHSAAVIGEGTGHAITNALARSTARDVDGA